MVGLRDCKLQTVSDCRKVVSLFNKTLKERLAKSKRLAYLDFSDALLMEDGIKLNPQYGQYSCTNYLSECMSVLVAVSRACEFDRHTLNQGESTSLTVLFMIQSWTALTYIRVT